MTSLKILQCDRNLRYVHRYEVSGMSTDTKSPVCPQIRNLRHVHRYEISGVSTDTKSPVCPQIRNLRHVHRYEISDMSTDTKSPVCPRLRNLRYVHRYAQLFELYFIQIIKFKTWVNTWLWEPRNPNTATDHLKQKFVSK